MSGKAKRTGVFGQETYDRAVLPTWMKRDLRDVIDMAVALGWIIHISTADAVTITSPNERKKYHFSPSGRTSIPLTRVRKDLFKHGDPAKVETLERATKVAQQGDREKARQMVEELPYTGDPGTVVDHTAEDEKAREDEQRRRAEAQQKKETSVTEDKPERTLVSKRPMIAKGGKSHGYESKTTIERHWSDGSIDYECAQGCGYTSDERTAVSRHVAGKHNKGKGTQPMPPRFAADVSGATRYKPRESRIAALAEVIERMMMTDTQDPKEIARTALTWVHEQTRDQTEHAIEAEPLTPEETLNKIRMLLDDGTMGEALKRIEDLETRAVAAEERASKAKADLTAFVSLAQDLAGDDEPKGKAS